MLSCTILCDVLDFDRLSSKVFPDLFSFEIEKTYPNCLLKRRRNPKKETKELSQQLKTRLLSFEKILGNLTQKEDFFFSDNSIISVFLTGNLLKDYKKKYLELLCCHVYRPYNKYVGFLLPLQEEIVLIDLSNWDTQFFVSEINQIGYHYLTSNTLKPSVENLSLFYSSVGSCVNNTGNIANIIYSRHESYSKLPFQVFISNPTKLPPTCYTREEKDEAFHASRKTGISWYTHSPFIINLALGTHSGALASELTNTREMGGKGVVVHTGMESDNAKNRCSTFNKTPLDMMEDMVRSSLSHSSKECPLIIETPSGEKNEMCCKIEELVSFFLRFTEEEMSVMGLCVDTCHVFAAGYNPILYLQSWEQMSKIPIKLVHFNDSSHQFGCRKDRHAVPGYGHIGAEILAQVANFCKERNIDMVEETNGRA